MSEKDLFYEFDAVGFEAWREKIVQDLKGKDWNQSVVWKTAENIHVQPFYVDEGHRISSWRKSPAWKITAPILISDRAHALALQNLQGGANHIHWIGSEQNVSLSVLLQDINLSIIQMSFQDFVWKDEHIDFLKENKAQNIHLGIQPLAALHSGQSESYDIDEIVKWVELKREIQADWNVLTIDASIYKNSGGHFVDEIAFMISALQENLHQLRSRGVSSDEIGTIQIRTAVGPNFFFEIAKLKVMRQLAQVICEQYEGAEIEILAESADLYHSQLDLETNILRLTTEGMSAVIGGAESVMLHPYNDTDENDFGYRLSRNIHHLLIEESYLDKQIDPAQGSYYVEKLCQDLKTPAWNVFLQIEKHQGYVHSFVGKSIPEFYIFRHKTALMKEAAYKRLVLLGTNQYPNLKDDAKTLEVPSQPSMKTTVLETFRLSESFESLRIRTQNHEAKHGTRPQALLWLHGAKGMRSARATFAFNFLATAGIPSYEIQAIDEWDAAVQEVQDSTAEIVVLCSDNASWEDFAPQALEIIGKDKIVILAGKSPDYPVHFIIYEGCPLLETLHVLLDKLGVER